MDLSTIQAFTKLKNIAVVGVSSKGNGFGVSVYNHLKNNGYNVLAINKNGGFSNNIKLYNSLAMLDIKIDGIVTVVPPAETEIVVQEAKELGIKQIWMQQGSESKNAMEFCKDNGIQFISGECIMMFVEPVNSIHKFHRWINKIIGKYPTQN